MVEIQKKSAIAKEILNNLLKRYVDSDINEEILNGATFLLKHHEQGMIKDMNKKRLEMTEAKENLERSIRITRAKITEYEEAERKELLDTEKSN